MVSPTLRIVKYRSALVVWTMRGGIDDLGIQTSEEKLHSMSNVQENHHSKAKHKYCTKLGCVFLLHPYHTSHIMVSLKLPPGWGDHWPRLDYFWCKTDQTIWESEPVSSVMWSHCNVQLNRSSECTNCTSYRTSITYSVSTYFWMFVNCWLYWTLCYRNKTEQN